MSQVLYPLCAALALAALIYKLPALLDAPRDPGRRALLATIAGIMLAFLFGAPQVYTAVDQMAGVPNLARLGAHGSATVVSLGLQVMLVSWAHPGEAVGRRIRLRLAIWAAAVSTMAALFLGGQADHDNPYVATRSGDDPFIWAYLFAFAGYLAWALADAMQLCWRLAARARPPFLPTGLRVLAVGCGLGLTYAVEKCGYVGGRIFRQELLGAATQESLSSSIAAASAAFLLLGFTLPSLGPQVAAIHRRSQLRPLWHLVRQAAPGIVLELRFADQRTRLTRCLVEIRDGRLALRGFMSRHIADVARDAGTAEGRTGEELDAWVEAAVLLDAAQSKTRGIHAADVYSDGPHHTDEGADLAWLVKVARAVRERRVQTLVREARTAEVAR